MPTAFSATRGVTQALTIRRLFLFLAPADRDRSGTGPDEARCQPETAARRTLMLRIVGVIVLIAIVLALLMVFGLLDAIF